MHNILTTLQITIRQKEVEIKRLREAVLAHARQNGNSLCWMNDHALYEAVLPPEQRPKDKRSLPKEQMLEECRKYVESCHDPSKPYLCLMDEGRKRDERIKELEARLEAYEMKSQKS